MGSGRIHGRPVMVAAEDFTVKAGTISQAANAKRHRVAELAVLDKVPLVMLLEGAGFRADGRPHARTPTDMLAQAHCSGRVPLITAVLGASAGHGALVAPMSDFTVMSAHGAIFTAGPPVVFESTGETVSKEDLGGPGVAVASGLIHNAAPDDAAALDLVRQYLTYFPSSAWSYPPDAPGDDIAPRLVPEMLDIVPRNGRKVYDMRDAIDVVFDAGSAFEVQPEFGRSMVTSLARLGGHPVAVIANQPRVIAGSIDVDGADKAAHFITVADSFHLPLVFFADNPGVLPGHRVGEAGHPAQRRAHVRGADDRDVTEVRGDVPQGVRLRLDGDGHDPVRRAVGGVRVPGRDDGRDGRGRDGPGHERRRGRSRPLAPSRAPGVVRHREQLRLRRADRPPRDPQRAAPLARARAAPAARPPAEPVAAHRDHAVTDIPWIVSVDDHVIEPTNLWTSRLPARVAGRGPARGAPARRRARSWRARATSSSPAPTARSSTTGCTATCTSR